MRIFVAGGTGVVGRPLVESLMDLGHAVTATTHRQEGLAAVAALGARAVLVDGLDAPTMRQAVLDARPDVVVNQMTALAAPARDYATWLAVTNRLRSEGTSTLMAAAREVGVRRVVAQSASFMTAPGTGPTDESSPLYTDAQEPIRAHVLANAAAEDLVLGTPGVEGLVLRYGFLYGEGTAVGPGGDWASGVQAGTLPVVGDGAGRYPFIHVRDAVRATVDAVHGGRPGVYNVVDDEPAEQGLWLPYLAELLGGPPPARISEARGRTELGPQAVYFGTQLRAASNARAKAELGMTLEHPSWRDGFRAVFSLVARL